MRPKVYNEPRIQTGLRLPESLHAQLAQAAADRDLTMNRLVEFAIRDFLGRLIPVEEIKWTRDR